MVEYGLSFDICKRYHGYAHIHHILGICVEAEVFAMIIGDEALGKDLGYTREFLEQMCYKFMFATHCVLLLNDASHRRRVRA